MARKMYLKGEIDGPSGQAPQAAWQAVEGEVRRSEDIWIAGDPISLQLGTSDALLARIKERLHIPKEPVGLRLRFVVTEQQAAAIDLLLLVRKVLGEFKEIGATLFFHAEVMTGPESGLYLALENRPPALLTQLHFASDSSSVRTGTADSEVAPGAVRLNLLLHDTTLGFAEALDGSLVEETLNRLAPTSGNAVRQKRVQELSVARSDAQSTGISVGIEQVGRQEGASGGSSAAEDGSRDFPFAPIIDDPTTM